MDAVACVSDQNECERDGMCMHSCRNTYGSFQCSCNQGYELAADGRSCEGQSAGITCVTMVIFHVAIRHMRYDDFMWDVREMTGL